MQAEDRIIHFSTELIHPPVQTPKEILQRLYFELTQTRASYDSTDFSNPGQVRFYSQRGKKTQSVLMILPDRIIIIEEWADIALSDFLEKVQAVGERALAARGISHYLAHTAMIRSTFALTHWDDARVFLMDHACGQAGLIEPYFHRPIAVGGLRYVLPESETDPGQLHVTIESFRHSKNELFVEVKGIFGRQPVGAGQMNVVQDNIRAVRDFISGRIHPYLNQFDQPRKVEM